MDVQEITELVDLNYELTANWKDKSHKLQERRWREIERHTNKLKSSHKHHGHGSQSIRSVM